MLQRPHFFPNDKPSSVAQTAHCVRIISPYKRAMGSLATKLREPGHFEASGHKDTSKFAAVLGVAFPCLCEAYRGCQTAGKFKHGAAETLACPPSSAATRRAARHN